eukprot:SAG11_NODE_1196_length_5545_cov_17.791407_7_plen_105_part_00
MAVRIHSALRIPPVGLFDQLLLQYLVVPFDLQYSTFMLLNYLARAAAGAVAEVLPALSLAVPPFPPGVRDDLRVDGILAAAHWRGHLHTEAVRHRSLPQLHRMP